MQNHEISNVIGGWLKDAFHVKGGKFLSQKLDSEQSFLNSFDFIFSIFDQINLKYIVVDTAIIPNEEIVNIPLPALTISYEDLGPDRLISDIKVIKNKDYFYTNKNNFIVIPSDSKLQPIPLREIIPGIISLWKKNVEKIIFTLMFGIGFFLNYFDFNHLIIFGLSLFGMILSKDLLDEQRGEANKNALIKKVCSGGTSTQGTNCQKLSHKSPKLFGYFDWSEMGVAIFWIILVNLLFLGVGGFSSLLSYFILGISTVGVLFSFYSFYQQFQLKIFCRACTITMLIFYVMFGVSLYSSSLIDFSQIINSDLLFPILSILSISIFGLGRVFNDKKMNILKGKYSYTRIRLMDFVKDQDIFGQINNRFIHKEDYENLKKYSHVINPSENEDNTMTFFVCAHCVHCTTALKELYHKHVGSNVGIRIAYKPVALNYDTEEIAIKRASKMIAILETYGLESFIKLFESYQENNKDSAYLEDMINNHYPVEEGILDKTSEKATAILKIAKNYDIISFPTKIIGQTIVSSVYSLEDLSYHV